MATPRIDPDVLAQVVLDAQVLGVDAAAKRHKLSRKTVQRYCDRAASSPELSRAVSEKKAPLVASWVEATEAARQRILARVLALAETSDELRDVAGALKIVTDAHIAERVVANGLGEPGAGAAYPSATAADAAVNLERFAARTIQ